MGWFDEQIRQRKDNDQEVFEESIFRVASAVLGNQRAGLLRDERFITKEAIDDILKYYHYKPVEIPDSVRDPDEQLEFCLRPHGVMWRSVTREEGWYKDSYGPMLAFRKEDGVPVALLPNPFLRGNCALPPVRILVLYQHEKDFFRTLSLIFYHLKREFFPNRKSSTDPSQQVRFRNETL